MTTSGYVHVGREPSAWKRLTGRERRAAILATIAVPVFFLEYIWAAGYFPITLMFTALMVLLSIPVWVWVRRFVKVVGGVVRPPAAAAQRVMNGFVLWFLAVVATGFFAVNESNDSGVYSSLLMRVLGYTPSSPHSDQMDDAMGGSSFGMLLSLAVAVAALIVTWVASRGLLAKNLAKAAAAAARQPGGTPAVPGGSGGVWSAIPQGPISGPPPTTSPAPRHVAPAEPTSTSGGWTPPGPTTSDTPGLWPMGPGPGGAATPPLPPAPPPLPERQPTDPDDRFRPPKV